MFLIKFILAFKISGKQHSFKIIHCLIMRQLSKFFIYGMSFPHNFLFNIKEERHYKIKLMEILFVSTCICFNYTYFICQKRMILFTNNRLIHWKGVKVELAIIGVIIRPMAHVNWTSLLSTINFWQDVWDYLIHF